MVIVREIVGDLGPLASVEAAKAADAFNPPSADIEHRYDQHIELLSRDLLGNLPCICVVSLSFACVVGSALLVLSAFWHNSCSLAIKTLPRAVQTRLPATYCFRRETDNVAT